ncbi:MAG: hypothetical protein ACK45B_14355 [Limisphaerales bacterium]
MKASTIALMAALALGCLVNANAQQERPTRPERPNRPERPEAGAPRQRPAAELGLNEEQRTKFEAVMREAQEKRRALREDTSLTPEQRREKNQAIQKEVDAKVKEILTAEQYAKWEKMQQERRRGQPGQPGGPGGPGGPGPRAGQSGGAGGPPPR